MSTPQIPGWLEKTFAAVVLAIIALGIIWECFIDWRTKSLIKEVAEKCLMAVVLSFFGLATLALAAFCIWRLVA